MTRRIRRRRLVLAALVTASVSLLIADSQLRPGQQGVAQARSWIGDSVAPVQKAFSSVPTALDSIGRAVAELGGGKSDQIAALQRENASLRTQIEQGEYYRSRSAELDGLLKVAGLGNYRIVPAQMVAVGSAGGFARAISLDVGSLDGISVNQTVLNAWGLVGRVTSVSTSTCTVALLIDASSVVGIRLENQQAGFATGGGRIDLPLAVDLFNPATEVKKGDRLVTFGSPNGSPYVPGVPVGEVSQVEGLTGQLTKRVQVRPFVDFGAVNLVGVVVEPPRADPRLAVLPPKPRPTPTPTVTVTATVTTAPSRPPAGGSATGGPSPNRPSVSQTVPANPQPLASSSPRPSSNTPSPVVTHWDRWQGGQ